MDAALLDLDRTLEPQLRTAAVEVRPAPAPAESDGAVEVARFIKELGDHRHRFDELTAMTRDGVEKICGADHFFPIEAREPIARIEAVMRTWAPRYGSLRIPEVHPLAISFRAWVRPYNDAVVALTRALVDGSVALRARLAEEAADDLAADEWAASHPPLAEDAETVPWEDVRARMV